MEGKRKMQPRRSMLGYRTHLYNTDSPKATEGSTTNDDGLAQNRNYEPSSQNKSYNNSNVEAPHGKLLNPPDTSSPLFSVGRRKLEEENRYGMSVGDSKSPLNPFGYDEGGTTFFERDINELGTWSVFKTACPGIKSPESCSTKIKDRNGRFSKRLASSSSGISDNTSKRTLFEDSQQNIRRFSERLASSSSGISRNKMHEDYQQNVRRFARDVTNDENASTQHKCVPSENTKRETTLGTISEETSLTRNNNDLHFKEDLEKLKELCVNFQHHSSNLDKMLAEILKEKVLYNNKLNDIQYAIKEFELKYNRYKY